MKRLLITLIALLVCAGLSQATGYHYRQQFAIAPVIAPVYVQPLAIATCGAAYTAPSVQQLVVPQIAPLVGQASVTQSYAIQGATAQVVTQPVVQAVTTQAYTAPLVQQVVTPSYGPLAVVGNAYSHTQAVRVLQVRQRLNYHGVRQVVVGGRQSVVVDNAAVAVRTRVGGVLSGVGRFLFGRQVETVIAPQRAAIVVPRRAAVQINAPGVRVRVR